jgi:hypothetical protein
VGEVDVTGGDLVEHRGEEKEIVPADEGDLHPGASTLQSFEVPGGVDAPEPSPEDEYADRPGHAGSMPAVTRRFITVC